MNRSSLLAVKTWSKESSEIAETPLISEEPLLIKLEDTPFSVILRTPGEEKAHAAGLCLAEGIVEHREDISGIHVSENHVTVSLKEHLHERVPEAMKRQGFMNKTAEKIGSPDVMEMLARHLPTPNRNIRIDPERAFQCLTGLDEIQPLRSETRAAHAAAVYSRSYELLALSEDVGRHNALDKSIGKLFLEGRLKEAAFLVMSSRISYELVQKASRAGIPVIISMSRPTGFAVKLATHLNMTLACLAKGRGLHMFTGEHRFNG